MTSILVLLPLLAAAAPSANESTTVVALQWSPHYECFSNPSCTTSAESALNGVLVGRNVSFASVIELEDGAYVPPNGYEKMEDVVCGRDTIALVHHKKWKTWDVNPSRGEVGCMVDSDRPFGVYPLYNQETNAIVVVAIAHFPHGPGTSAYSSAAAKLGSHINSVVEDVQENQRGPYPAVVLLADTNAAAGDLTSVQVAGALELADASGLKSTELLKSCCLNSGFPFEYGRIIATHAVSIDTEMLFDPAPQWAIGEFHKAILGTLRLEHS